jgi:hypothetical protein
MLVACFNFSTAACAIRMPEARRIEPLAGHGFAPCEIAAGAVTIPAHGAFFANLHNGPAGHA